MGESEGLCDPRVRGSETRGRSTAAGKEQHLEAWGATQRTSAGPYVGSRPNALSWPGLPLARLRVLGTPGSHDGEFWATGTGRHWDHRLRQGPFLLPREGGFSASPGASAHRFLRFGEGSRPRSAPLHCHEGLGQRRRRRQAPSRPSPAGQGRHLQAYSGTRDPCGSSPGWSAPGLLRTSRRPASLLGWCLEL